MTEEKVRVLIVDDEPLARSMVRRMLADRSNVEIAGECENGEEAIAAIRNLAPDLVFLDVQMPRLDGFSVIESLVSEPLPHIVFVTAYDQYGVRAFEVHALDYLLKPFDRKRFDQALHRALTRIKTDRRDEFNERVLSLLSDRMPPATYLERFIIKDDGRIFFLKTDEIKWIEAKGNYVLLHTAKKNHLFREAISNLETQLDPRKFQRISRSVIVNLNHICELQPWSHGDYKILLDDMTELKLSHRFRESFNKYLGGAL